MGSLSHRQLKTQSRDEPKILSIPPRLESCQPQLHQNGRMGHQVEGFILYCGTTLSKYICSAYRPRPNSFFYQNSDGSGPKQSYIALVEMKCQSNRLLVRQPMISISSNTYLRGLRIFQAVGPDILNKSGFAARVAFLRASLPKRVGALHSANDDGPMAN